jgi:hypothetical protein
MPDYTAVDGASLVPLDGCSPEAFRALYRTIDALRKQWEADDE